MKSITSFLTPRQVTLLTLFIILSLGFLLPLLPLVSNPLHHDEALYAYWARLIASGQDRALSRVPLDKPPLFIYTLALFFKMMGVNETAARIPSLIAHPGAIAFTYALGKRLYARRIGLLAALLLALSPYSILFASTAFTDALMLSFVMASAWAAAQQKPAPAALLLGLAAATKQQGVFFLPLIWALLLLRQRADGEGANKETGRGGYRRWGAQVIKSSSFILLVSFAATLLIPLIWDAGRVRRPGFWLQSSLSYGPLTFAPAQFAARLAAFTALLKFAAASSILNLIFALGLPLLLLSGVFIFRKTSQDWQADWLLAGFCAAFLLLHALLTFRIWDRYLLGLIPFLSLLLARILHLPAIFIKLREGKRVRGRKGEISPPHPFRFGASPSHFSFFAFILVMALMARPAQQAIQSGYPIGGDHGAYYGAAEVAAYLRGHAGANITLYHRWLGAHWNFYLFRFPYDFRYWASAKDLAAQAKANAHGAQYIAFPAWQSSSPAELALSDVGLTMRPVFKTYKADGGPGIFLYRIEVSAKTN